MEQASVRLRDQPNRPPDRPPDRLQNQRRQRRRSLRNRTPIRLMITLSPSIRLKTLAWKNRTVVMSRTNRIPHCHLLPNHCCKYAVFVQHPARTQRSTSLDAKRHDQQSRTMERSSQSGKSNPSSRCCRLPGPHQNVGCSWHLR